jgi:diguanylate cyclase
MRYTQSKEQSAEVLRLALGLMGQHDAAFNPLTFTVWYEHASGINSRLSHSIEECLRAEPRLGDTTIARLYREHVSEIDESAIELARGRLDQVMTGMAESAARTGDRAGVFGAALGSLKQALHGKAVHDLQADISRVLEGTTEMKDSAAALQRQVAASRLEIEQLRDDLSRARDEALVDPLTRIVNRKGFDQRIRGMLGEAPGPERSHWLVMLDIDRFKAVNDTYGHVMGDRVLQAVAEVLRGCITDSAHCVARYGGEEFAFLLPHCAPGLAQALAEVGRQRVKALKVRDRRTQSVVLTVTISAGVASMQPGDDAQTLVARADEALYAAKEAGRDRVICA